MWLKRPLKGLANFKMRKELHLGKDATFHFGSGKAERWRNGIRESLFDDWPYFDSQEKKLGLLRKTQWMVHYRLDRAVTSS